MIDQIIKANRINQILGLGTPVNPNQLQPPPQPFNEEARLRELYQPETVMNDRFRGLIDQMPQRENPSLLRKIGSVIVGAGSNSPQEAMLASERFAQMPFYRRLEDWENKIKPVQMAADNERQDNTQRLAMAKATLANEQFERRQSEIERKNLETQKLAQERETRIRKHEADRISIQRYLADNPVMRSQVGNDGYLYLVDPRTGESTRTNVLTGELSDIQAAELGLKNALTRIQAQNAANRSLEEIRQGNRLELEGTRQQNRESLLRQRQEEWNLLPAQKRQLIQHNAEQLIRENPGLAEFIKQDPNTGMIEVADVEEDRGQGLFTGPRASRFTKEQRDEVIRRLNQGQDTPRRTTTTTTTTPKVRDKVGVNDDKRAEAIKILETNKKPVTEANIAYILKQLGAR